MSIRNKQQLYSCKLATFQLAGHVLPVWADPVGCTTYKNSVVVVAVVVVCLVFIGSQLLCDKFENPLSYQREWP